MSISVATVEEIVHCGEAGATLGTGVQGEEVTVHDLAAMAEF